MEASSAGEVVIDPDGITVDVNEVFLRMTGFSRSDVVEKDIEDFLSHDGCSIARQYLRGGVYSYSAVFEATYSHKNGSCHRVELTVRLHSQSPRTFSLVFNELEAMKASQRRAMLTQYTLDKVSDMIIWLDADARYIFVNQAATRLLGYSASELRQKRVWDIDPLFDEARWRAHWLDIVGQGCVKIETVNTNKQGVDVPIEVTANLVFYNGMQYNCSIVRDITERKKLEAEWRFINERANQLSVTDALTGIANRRRFDMTLESEVKRHYRSGSTLSLILCDVDAFKAFNDCYGHVAGDDCLRRVAAALATAMKRPADLVARFGGEEFACILPETDAAGAARVAELARELILALAIPHERSPAAEVVSASFGVLTVPPQARYSEREIMSCVDAYLYQAKDVGRNRVVCGALQALRD